jgi:hypothetical protein
LARTRTTDSQLLEAFLGGDSRAFEEIYGRYGRMVYSVALRVLDEYYWVDIPSISDGKPYKGRRGRPAPNLRVTSAMQ